MADEIDFPLPDPDPDPDPHPDPGPGTDPDPGTETGQDPGTQTDPEAPDHRPRRSFVSRHFFWVVNGGVVLVVLIVLVVGWFWYRSAESGTPKEGVVVTVSSGESFGSVRSALEGDGVIGNGFAFQIYSLFHATPTVQPGQYYLRKGESFATTFGILGNEPNVLALQIPPGFTVAEVSGRLESEGAADLGAQLQKLATSGAVRSPFQPPGSKNLDGLLGAGTYTILPVDTAQTLLTEMIDRFRSSAASAGLTPGDTVNGLDAYQVVTVASIVEKEGVYEKNMGKVSRVIYNRLKNGMPLQMDSTVLYSLGQDGGPVTPADLQIKSPYNSYLNTGLTPTPICFPSSQALTAALHPTPGKWLYFTLISEDGTEGFSVTYAGQVANEKLATSRGLP
jgi:UPF0755 protein